MKFLLLTASFGGGHNEATKNLNNYLENIGFKSKIIDLVGFSKITYGRPLQKIYDLSSIEYPFIWEKFFKLTDKLIFAKILNNFYNPHLINKFSKLLNEYKPNIIIATHPLWNQFIKNQKTNIKFKYGILITDHIQIQSFWYLEPKYVYKYFVLDKYSKDIIIKKFNLPENKVIVSGFPLPKEIFINKNLDNIQNILILLTGFNETFSKELLNNLKNYNLIILKGRDKKVYEKLKSNFKHIPNFDFKEYFDIKKQIKNIDLIISKPGGALLNECIASSTPIICPFYIGGQEEGNIQYLNLTQTGIYEPNPDKIKFLIKYINWQKLQKNFETIKNPNSAKIIIDNLIN